MLLIIFMMAIEKFLKLSTYSRALILLDLIDQIRGATPTIPRMFQNMFPLASGQVISLRLYVFFIHIGHLQFGALPVMPVQAGEKLTLSVKGSLP